MIVHFFVHEETYFSKFFFVNFFIKGGSYLTFLYFKFISAELF